MDVKRYFAPTAREALRALKAELGGEAIVLSNRAVAGGVEILALPPEAINTLHVPQPTSRAAPARPAAPRAAAADFDDDFHVTLSSLAAGAIPRQLAASAPAGRAHTPGEPEFGSDAPEPRPLIRPFSPPRVETADYTARNARAASPPRRDEAPPVSERVVERMVERVVKKVAAHDLDANHERVRALQEDNVRLMDELTGIRGIIERELAGFSWNETRRSAPARAAMLGQLLAAGFSSDLATRISESVGETASPETAQEVARAALDGWMKVRASDSSSGGSEIIDAGGVFALVGPTGVGKTTTVAKLAARFVARHGAGQLALITTDGYRIGAQEQLRIYGRILGVPVFAVRDPVDLRQTLLELDNKKMVLIDTMGMSQRDRMVVEQATMLAGAGEVRRLLLLNATCRGDTLDDVVHAFAGPDMAGCILTKVDEAVSLAPVIDIAVRHAIEVCYVTNGQRVPEDLHLPDRAWLLQRALRPQADASPWRLDNNSTGLLLAQGA
jgi:flagellar biosynthesis protein FlhF